MNTTTEDGASQQVERDRHLERDHTHRKFEVDGMVVREYVFPEFRPGIGKVAWVRDDLHKLVVDGQWNMVAHAEFGLHQPSPPYDVDQARDMVEREFRRYWQNPNPVNPKKEPK